MCQLTPVSPTLCLIAYMVQQEIFTQLSDESFNRISRKIYWNPPQVFNRSTHLSGTLYVETTVLLYQNLVLSGLQTIKMQRKL